MRAGLQSAQSAEDEALLKLASARTVLDAMLGGHWHTSTGTLDEVRQLIFAASVHLTHDRLAQRPNLRALRGGGAA